MNYLQAFEHRLRHDASAPLVTWYDVDAGARVELSATTFGNWVDKCGHLMADEVDLAPGDRVALPLLAERPGHWMSLVLVAACWHLGAAVTPEVVDEAELIVGGPEIEPDPGGRPTWAVSLHPLGMGLPRVTPGVLDWAGEVRGYPDLHVPPTGGADDLAWVDPPITVAELTAVPGSRPRSLVRAGAPWPTVQAGLVTPVLTGGSVVLVEGSADNERIAAIRADERITG